MKTISKHATLRGARRASALALTVAAVLGNAAMAADETSSVLEEIVVTAERRTQNLQEVPIAATVLTAEALDSMGVDNVNDLQLVAPSLAINTYNRSTFVNIRGVGIAQSAPTSSPGVAFYVDGNFIPHEFMIGQSFYDLAAVEVLRGPQGTLTGQNSTGGAVFVRTPDPVIGEWSGYGDITIGDYEWKRAIVAANIPIGNMLALRIAGTRDERESFYDNQGSSSKSPGNVDFRGYRGSLLFQPLDALKVMLRYEDYLNDFDHNALKNRFDAITPEPFVIEEDAESYFLQEGYRASGEVTYDFSSIRLRWLTNYQFGSTQDLADGDRTTTALPNVANQGRIGYGRTAINTLINEANVLSTGDGPFNWVAGLFSLEEDVDVTLRRFTNSTTVVPPPPAPAASTTLALATNTSESVFGQASFKFAERFEVIAGARYSEDKQVYDRNTAVPTDTPGVQESDQVTGRAAFNWTPAEDLLLYVSAAKGYKAGGVNLGPTDPNFEPENNLVYELGSKITTLDGRLRINSDVFYSVYKDIQLISLRNNLPYTQNASEGTSYGLEVEMQGAFGNLEFNMGLAYLLAEFSNDTVLNLAERVDPRIPPAQLTPGHASNSIRNRSVPVSSGQPLPFSPEITGNIGVQYNIRVGNGKLTPRVQYSYLAEQFSTPFKPSDYQYGDLTTVPSRSIVDVRVTYEPIDTVRLEAFATNIGGETYIAGQVQDSTTAIGGLAYGAPRQVGVRAVFKFN